MPYATSEDKKECSQESGPRQKRQQLMEKTICGEEHVMNWVAQRERKESLPAGLCSKTQRKVSAISKGVND